MASRSTPEPSRDCNPKSWINIFRLSPFRMVASCFNSTITLKPMCSNSGNTSDNGIGRSG